MANVTQLVDMTLNDL